MVAFPRCYHIGTFSIFAQQMTAADILDFECFATDYEMQIDKIVGRYVPEIFC